ncbi:hypothetical protein [Stenotrophomonas rhizophila]|uniref:hypothetical protein n=1 Tax=Stenotrophomonas rhizophila TaxID=216778 RepID=UPI001140F672|nr:hypothetical protein [Stenotrophomonas rhizophila]
MAKPPHRAGVSLENGVASVAHGSATIGGAQDGIEQASISLMIVIIIRFGKIDRHFAPPVLRAAAAILAA